MTKNKRLTDQIRTYIIKCSPHDFINLTVNEIARRFNITVPDLSRAFKKEQEINLRKFIFNEKITRSRYLLKRYQQLTVKEVAEVLGYSSSNYFIRIFKNKVGVTPGKFRKINGGFFGLFDRRKNYRDRR